MSDVVTRLNAPVTPAAEPKPAAGLTVTETANGGVVVRKDDTATAPNEGEPKLILGKFKDQAALEKAYSELEKKMGSKKEETPAAPAAPVVDAASAAAKGIDLKALGEEYIAGGNKLSDASMAKLAAAGITAEQVSTYIAGQQAQASKIAEDLATVTGGQEKLTATLEWAKANASPEQKAAFDAALDTNNTAVIKAVLSQIHSDYTKAMGTDPTLVSGAQVPHSTGVQPFNSQEEITAAMRDPRYKNGDRAYIKSVEGRLAVTNIWNRK